MAPIIRTVYWDASIFLALLFLEKRTIDAVMRMLESLYATDTKLAIGPTLELEVVDTIRRRIMRRAKYASTMDAEYAASNMTSAFFGMIQTLEHDGKITRIGSDEPVTAYCKSLLRILLDHPGRAVADLAGRMRHKGAGYRDIEHVYHAAIASVDVFYTLDSGFKSIFGNTAFAKVCFVILGRKAADSGGPDHTVTS